MPKKKKQKTKKEDQRIRKASKSVLRFLQERAGRSYNYKQIAKGAGLNGSVAGRHLIRLLDQLVDKGKLHKVDRGKYIYPREVETLTGKLDMARDGFGFVRPDDGGEDVFIGAGKINKALNGDIVKVRLTRKGRGGRSREGEIIELIERAKTAFVGTVEISEDTKFAFLIPDDTRMYVDFFISPDHLGGAKDGQKVLAELISWEGRSPEVKVTEILGDAGENETEMHAILLQYGFEKHFPKVVDQEAERLPEIIPEAEIKLRRDMRGVTTFTIDPDDAKDFDDALSIQYLDDGNLEIGVHVADVSWYVRPGTEIDKEGFKRATSVYLVDRTVPMLPERISNFLCSLRPNEDKLAFTAVFKMTPDGKILDSWFGRTIIHSDHRFTYDEAQRVMDHGEGLYYKELTDLNSIAKILRKKRFEQGSLNFEDEEVKFVLDAEGRPINTFTKVRKDAHKLIEDFMLLANRKVAEWVSNLGKKGEEGPAFVYRIHEYPDIEKLETLATFVKNFGYELELQTPEAIRRTLNQLLEDVEGKPEEHVVQSVAIRSMAKAIYSTRNVGHYGLGFKNYTHFTSPIRRYPDLMVHRLLDHYLQGNLNIQVGNLEAKCRHSSEMEKKATEAERTSVKQKQVEFLMDKIGHVFEGIISGVTNWGIYVEIKQNKCEGMVSMNNLEDDYYNYDEKNYQLVGQDTGRKLRLGDVVYVEVADTDLQRRTIDFKLADKTEKNKAGEADA